MKHHRVKLKRSGLLAAALAASLSVGPVLAGSDSLFMEGLNESEFMKSLGISAGGWLDFGATYNAHSPNDNFNTPVLFNDRHLELQANQLYFYLERQVNTEGNSWDFGGRADLLFGTDGRFTLNDDLDDDILDDDDSRFYRLSFPQIYFEVYAPVLNGITAKIGHFYTIIGNEVVTSPDNFFYSHAYTMLFAEPFEHNGVLFTTPINDNFTLMSGAVLGWDNFSRHTDVWNFLGGVSWSSDDERTGVTVTAITGAVDDDRPNDERWLYSIVATHDISDKLHYTFQHDHAREEQSGRDVEWYGINQYLTYDINDQLAAGIRGEWFRDDDGARVTGVAGSYYAVTAGVNFSPIGWLKLRPEVRYDWFDGQGNTFDGFTENDQFTVAVDVIINF